MFKILKSEQKTFSDETLDSSAYKTNSDAISNNNNSFIISSKNEDFLGKKRFITKNKYSKIEKISNEKISYGLWNQSEHNKFIEALYIHNCEWKKIKEYLGNRTRNKYVRILKNFFCDLKFLKIFN